MFFWSFLGKDQAAEITRHRTAFALQTNRRKRSAKRLIPDKENFARRHIAQKRHRDQALVDTLISAQCVVLLSFSAYLYRSRLRRAREICYEVVDAGCTLSVGSMCARLRPSHTDGARGSSDGAWFWKIYIIRDDGGGDLLRNADGAYLFMNVGRRVFRIGYLEYPWATLKQLLYGSAFQTMNEPPSQ